MRTTALSKRLTLAGLALWLGLLGCGFLNTTTIGDLKTESQSVELESAKSVSVQIEFQVGELKVESGANSIMDANFRYNMDGFQPKIKYSETGEQGELIVNQQALDRLPVGGELINEWNIQLAKDVLIDLAIQTGAGNTDLYLGDLDLTRLNIETGAGVTNVDLNGTWQHDLDVSIKGGVGELTVKLPTGMGVRVNKETALVNVSADGLIVDGNGYVNETFGVVPYTLTLDLQAGVGSVTLVAP